MPFCNHHLKTVGGFFKVQLDVLMHELDAMAPQYVRCIKTNTVKRPAVFEPDLVFEQLNYSGVFEAVIIQRSGYPCRLRHLDFRQRFHMLASDKSKATHDAIFNGSNSKSQCQTMVTKIAESISRVEEVSSMLR